MKPAPLLLTFPFLFSASVLQARPLAKPELRADGRYEFRDNGLPSVKFQVALDEVMETTPGGERRVMVGSRQNLRSVHEAARSLASSGRKIDLVVYKEGEPQIDANRRVLSNKVSVTLAEGIDPTAVGLSVNAVGMKTMVYAPGDYIIELPDALDALTAAEALKTQPGITQVSVLLGRKLLPSFLPNDPLMSPGTGGQYGGPIFRDFTDEPAIPPTPWPMVSQGQTKATQWYMNRENSIGQVPLIPAVPYAELQIPPFYEASLNGLYPEYFSSPVDINVIDAWDLIAPDSLPVDGSGVKVGILDDGVLLDHTDFNRTNQLRMLNHNFLSGDETNANPVGRPVPQHGTAMAGLILANRGNSRGMAGVAPDAKLVALRVVGQAITPEVGANALVWGADRLAPQITPNNPFGLPTGHEYFRGQPNFDIANNAYKIEYSSGSSLVPLDKWFNKALIYGVNEGRLTKGVIYVVPAGSDGWFHGDVNQVGLTNSIYTLTVGGISDLGRRIAYSTSGAALNVVAPTTGDEMASRIKAPTGNLFIPNNVPPTIPASDRERAFGWTTSQDDWFAAASTTRRTQDIVSLDSASPTSYYQAYSGTSVSAALTSGVVALMLEANPALGWRDVHEIIMRSAFPIDGMMGEWEYNSMGMPMSHKYGAGLIDATHAVRMAKVWKNLGARYGGQHGTVGTPYYKEYRGDAKLRLPIGNIQDNKDAPLLINVPAPSSSLRVEQVIVRLKIRHARRGDLGITLIAPPSGQSDKPLESYLYVPHREDTAENIGRPELDDGAGDNDVEEGEYWDFTTVRHWGTSSLNPSLLPGTPGGGNWTLKIWDNTTRGVVNGNPNQRDPELRISVSKPNPSPAQLPQSVVYASVIFHGTDAASENEAPVISNEVMIGKINTPFQAQVRAFTDLSTGADGTPRAPIEHYRIRVLGGLTSGAPPLIIGPTTAQEYRDYLAAGGPPAFMRFNRLTGLLTTAPYPDDGGPPPPPFVALPLHSWNIELRATNVFGTIRRQIPFHIRQSVTYAQWRDLFFSDADKQNPNISGDAADPDGDGLPNKVEYAVGGYPNVPNPDKVPTFTQVESNIQFNFQLDRTITGVRVTTEAAEVLDDEDAWTTVDDELVTNNSAILQTRRAILPIDPAKPRQFIRLRVQ